MSEINEVVEAVSASIPEAVVKSEKMIAGFSVKEIGVGAGLVAGGGLITEGIHQVVKHRPIKKFFGKVKRFIAFEKETKVKPEPEPEEVKTEKTEE